MAETTDIEKKSLEAHVELCAERYRNLDDRLATLDEKIESVGETADDIRNKLDEMSDKNTDRLINWGIGIIGTLVGTIAWLLSQYVLK